MGASVAVEGRRSRGLWWGLFAAAALAASVVILHEGRAWTFNVDDWGMILYRRSGGLSAYVAPHNGNFAPALTAMYRVLFGTTGLRDFTVYRCVELAIHLAFSALLFAYLRTRLPAGIAFLGTLPVLFLAYGYSVLVWSYDAVWIVPLACMVLVFLVGDRGGRRRGLITMLLLLAAVLSSGPVSAVLVAVALDSALDRAKWREWWAVAVPIAAYGAWALLVRPHVETPVSLRSVPGAIPDDDTQHNILAFGLHSSGLPHLPDALLKTSNWATGGL